MSSFEKDLEEIANSETLSPIAELKIVAPIYFRNNISDRKGFISQLAKKMKIKDITAYVYFMSMLTGKLYENMPPTYFKMMKKATDILNAPEYLKDLLKQAKKQPKEKRLIPTIEEKIQKINEEANKEGIKFEECRPAPGYENKHIETIKLENGSTRKTIILENGRKYRITTRPNGEITNETYHPRIGWTFGPDF